MSLSSSYMIVIMVTIIMFIMIFKFLKGIMMIPSNISSHLVGFHINGPFVINRAHDNHDL